MSRHGQHQIQNLVMILKTTPTVQSNLVVAARNRHRVECECVQLMPSCTTVCVHDAVQSGSSCQKSPSCRIRMCSAHVQLHNSVYTTQQFLGIFWAQRSKIHQRDLLCKLKGKYAVH